MKSGEIIPCPCHLPTSHTLARLRGRLEWVVLKSKDLICHKIFQTSVFLHNGGSGCELPKIDDFVYQSESVTICLGSINPEQSQRPKMVGDEKVAEDYLGCCWFLSVVTSGSIHRNISIFRPPPENILFTVFNLDFHGD